MYFHVNEVAFLKTLMCIAARSSSSATQKNIECITEPLLALDELNKEDASIKQIQTHNKVRAHSVRGISKAGD